MAQQEIELARSTEEEKQSRSRACAIPRPNAATALASGWNAQQTVIDELRARCRRKSSGRSVLPAPRPSVRAAKHPLRRWLRAGRWRQHYSAGRLGCGGSRVGLHAVPNRLRRRGGKLVSQQGRCRASRSLRVLPIGRMRPTVPWISCRGVTHSGQCHTVLLVDFNSMGNDLDPVRSGKYCAGPREAIENEVAWRWSEQSSST